MGAASHPIAHAEPGAGTEEEAEPTAAGPKGPTQPGASKSSGNGVTPSKPGRGTRPPLPALVLGLAGVAGACWLYRRWRRSRDPASRRRRLNKALLFTKRFPVIPRDETQALRTRTFVISERWVRLACRTAGSRHQSRGPGGGCALRGAALRPLCCVAACIGKGNPVEVLESHGPGPRILWEPSARARPLADCPSAAPADLPRLSPPPAASTLIRRHARRSRKRACSWKLWSLGACTAPSAVGVEEALHVRSGRAGAGSLVACARRGRVGIPSPEGAET